MKPRLFRPALPAALLALSGSLPLAAQTSVTLDGASGSQTYDVARSTTGGLTLGLGFGVDYLIIGGGGSGAYATPNSDGIDGTGGGGAGGFVEGSTMLSPALISVSVGAGGSGVGSGMTLIRGNNGGNGGSGVVIVRYKGPAAGLGGPVTTGTGSAAGYTLHTFTTTGNSSLDLSGLNLNNRLGAIENGVISGTGDLTFTGPGTMTLNAANTYSGITRVNSGTLAIGSNGSIANSSGVSLANGARFNVSTATGGFTLGADQSLSGGGTITGDITIAGSHTPGFSPGIQNFTDDLSYTTGSSITWELIDDTLTGRGSQYDGINVSGNLAFSGATSLVLDFALSTSVVDWQDSFWDSDRTGIDGWKIFNVDGSISGFGNLTLDPADWLDGNDLALGSARPDASFSLFQGADGIYLNYSAVPEPASAVLGGLGVLLLLRRRRVG